MTALRLVAVPVAQQAFEPKRQGYTSLGGFWIDQMRQRGLRAGGGGRQIILVGVKVRAWPDLALTNDRVPDLQVEGQTEYLDVDVTLSYTGFERDGDPGQRASGGAEWVDTTSTQSEPLPLRSAEPEGELHRCHGDDSDPTCRRYVYTTQQARLTKATAVNRRTLRDV